MKIAIIVPYFGKLPSYFQIFLDSCKYNPDFEWIIFTDDNTEYKYPVNVHREEMNFEECRQLIQSKFDFEITLHTPQKLCDYKCAYGYIFQDFLEEYDWWGHCDLDQIFGDLSGFVTEERLNRCEKLYSLGHLTLYKNTQDNNKEFMSSLDGRERYKEVFTTERGCGFDEWLPDNVNEIYINSGRDIILENDGADVDSYHTAFTLVFYDVENRHYKCSYVKNSIFMWEKGHIYQVYVEQGELQQREFPYVHLQKRKMSDMRKNINAEKYYIIPNKFVDGDKDSRVLLKSCEKWLVLNYQFVKVKWKSLKYRLKSGDWKVSNVFK